MAEGSVHLELIESILQNVPNLIGAESLIFTDRPGESRDRKCPRINGFVPDVYAVQLRGDGKLIGEAKAAADFFQPHTLAQVRAFMDFLSFHPQATLVLAVPPRLLPAAKCLLRRAASERLDNIPRLLCCSPSFLIDA